MLNTEKRKPDFPAINRCCEPCAALVSAGLSGRQEPHEYLLRMPGIEVAPGTFTYRCLICDSWLAHSDAEVSEWRKLEPDELTA